jgi:phosphatidylserine/phosphatidylglycerophosphate/cardiolipin synthase-like enzyme
MDGLLGTLTPLASLLSRTTDPSVASAALAAALSSGDPGQVDETVQREFGPDAAAATAALCTAGIPAATDMDWRIRLAQSEVLALEFQQARQVAPSLVMTVPDFLRRAWAEYLRELPAADWPRETMPAMLDIASRAQNELLLAAPFFNVEHAQALASSVARLTGGGGRVLVVTQGTQRPGPETNTASLRLLHSRARSPGQIQVWSWPGPTLGVHFKTIVADRQHAYLGSANLTSHGALHHAEAGMILHGPLARQLDSWIRKIAAQPADHQILA